MHFCLIKRVEMKMAITFKNTILLLLVYFIVFTSCTKDPRKEQIKSIKKQESELYADQTIDRAKGLKMIDAYLNYSKQYPDDTLSAVYLFKAAEISMNLQLGSQSVFYFDKILTNYPNFYKLPECLFLKAFVFENQLGKIEKAGHFYNEFLIKYPNHILAKDAKASIEYLGKSPEELIKIFEEKNQTSH